ncbi:MULTISPECIES: hypothetical protein [Rhizobium]|uniref:Uncharacterized protein n=1 Tax=Rhizobium rhododendri TaxID=2506430 RepID=A0ABY8IJ24_9HYPH|nr:MULTISPECIES: hypothetical protein [Rhizobium]MBO9097143.1 hypothetical protein [Rhizobium sp. L58/93]MBO9167381.1 hypothetical protein [Rhizobium sp. L245/93]MBO9183340.1 hypothetical protein [Rhizobium sp. E27B/91]MBZ5759875.1 hypothetical protein [Rhizobium sp. VS19-DR96]MBZ5766263.1 hypothetical protein [Rhizobium sp. VS19-DR129.2]
MLFRTLMTSCILLALPALALADPTGTFDVTGSGDGSAYSGTVKVSRTGGTYDVQWTIAGEKFVGTGIGAKFTGDRFEMGPASSDDTAISVGYASKNNFGIAMYFEQPDGTWQGVWTYGGAKKVNMETWTRR